ncbi:MAG: DUF192 domain-containing protein [Halobacteriaceae archaeon]
MDARRAGAIALAALGVAAAAAVAAPHVPATVSTDTPAETARVVVTDGERTLGVVTAEVADTRGERYRGLSGRETLAPDRGMLFVFRTEAERAFVMREMAFGLDIVFVGADGRITAIHHAAPPPPDTPETELRRYTGRAKWVLEVNRGWTTRHNVSVGDRVRIEEPG